MKSGFFGSGLTVIFCLAGGALVAFGLVCIFGGIKIILDAIN